MLIPHGVFGTEKLCSDESGSIQGCNKFGRTWDVIGDITKERLSFQIMNNQGALQGVVSMGEFEIGKMIEGI